MSALSGTTMSLPPSRITFEQFATLIGLPALPAYDQLNHIVAEAMSLTPAVASADRRSLFEYQQPVLSEDGSCSLNGELDPTPFNVANYVYHTDVDKLDAATVSRHYRLEHIVTGLTAITGADWTGVYALLKQQNTNTHSEPQTTPQLELVKFCYCGDESRAVFPLTPAFIAKSNNSAVAANARAVIIDDVRQLPTGTPYYECSNKVRSEFCIPIVDVTITATNDVNNTAAVITTDGASVCGIIDCESFTAKHFSTQIIGEIAKVAYDLSLFGLITVYTTTH